MTKKRKSTILYAIIIFSFCFIILGIAATVIALNPSGTPFDIRGKFSHIASESSSSVAVLDDSKVWASLSGEIISDDVELRADDCLLIKGSILYFIYQTDKNEDCKNENCKSHVYVCTRDLNSSDTPTRYDIGCFTERYKSRPYVRDGDKVTTSFLKDGCIYVTDLVQAVKFNTESLLVESVGKGDEVSSLMLEYSARVGAKQICVTGIDGVPSKIIDAEYVSNRSEVGRMVVSYCDSDDAPVFYDYTFVIDGRLYFYMLPTDVFGNYYPTLFEYDYSSGDVNYVYMCSPVGFFVPDQKCVISYMP